MLRTARKTIIPLLFAIPLSAAAADFDAIEKLDDPAKRADAYEALLGEDPDSVEILFKLGNAYYDLQMPEEAILRYERSLRAGGGLPVMANLTFVLAERDRREEAEKVFVGFLAASPSDPLAHAHYADFLSESAELAKEPEEAKGLTQKASDEYRHALEIDPKNVEALFGMGVLFARAGIYEEAIREWKKALAADPRHRLASLLRTNITDAEKRLGR